MGVGTIVETQPDMQVVAEAANGAEAVQLHERHLPDVTLMDIRMPVMGGVEAMRAIRDRAPLARFIALSTYSGDEEIRTLPSRAISSLAPHLMPVILPRDMVLCHADELVTHVYFIETGLVSLVSVFENGTTAEMATVGREGLVGNRYPPRQ